MPRFRRGPEAFAAFFASGTTFLQRTWSVFGLFCEQRCTGSDALADVSETVVRAVAAGGAMASNALADEGKTVAEVSAGATKQHPTRL